MSIVWLRRDLRLYDHKPMALACEHSENFQPIFIFDQNILARFSNKKDRRLSFIAKTIYEMNLKLKKYNAEIIVLFGDPINIIPKLCEILKVKDIYAGQDFEEANIKRDENVAKKLGNKTQLHLICDHLIFSADKITKLNGEPYKVFTPYSKAWRAELTQKDYKEYTVDLGKINKEAAKLLKNCDLHLVNTASPQTMLKDIGYEYHEDDYWQPSNSQKILNKWHKKIDQYKDTRDLVSVDGTSQISPYLRFGLISIRECARLGMSFDSNGSFTWINELIWREFYASILYHFPETINLEFQEKYRNSIPWNNDKTLLKKWQDGLTGFPIVDAAMRQLKTLGWMHNRARMIVASFFTKNMLMDWRLGEEHFAQYLMDYELSSNVGGWQWASSTGTDAQPYFRIFNPYLQSEKFDPKGDYIRKYVEELRQYKGNIHKPDIMANYPQPIVNYEKTRAYAIKAFKEI